jgi:PPM family protein phosphatase
MIDVVWATTKGLFRENNEDSVLVDGKIFIEGFGKTTMTFPCMLAICDGLGGHQGGEIAAYQTLFELNKQAQNLIDSVSISDCLSSIHQKIKYKQRIEPDNYNMATTVAGVLVNNSSIIVFNVGDTRVYRYRLPYLKKLSMDHTAINELKLDNTVINVNGVITRCIGGNNAIPSIIDDDENFHDGDIYLLVTDGIYGFVEESKIQEIIVNASSLSSMAIDLFCEASKNQSNDNMSLIILRRKES